MTHEAGLDITNRFVLDFAADFARAHPGTRVLDYGCGAGKLVAEARARGVDMLGADVYYGGSRTREEAAHAGLLGSVVYEMAGGRLPFPDAHFRLVVNNQVMEHVEDLDAVLAEIRRVLSPDGVVLSIFPSRDVLREGHIGIPLAHRLPKGRLRLLYTWLLRSLGLGTWKEQAPTSRRWAEDKLGWIDRYTRYRRRSEIFASYGRWFHSALREPDYIRYRMRATPRLRKLAWIAHAPVAGPLGAALFRKLAFLVLVSRPKEAK